LVTLDDLHVAPVGVSRRTRRLAGFGGLIGVAIMAGAALWIFGGGFKDFLRDAFDQMAPEGKSFAETMGNLIGSFVAVLVVGALVLAFVLLVAAFFGAATLFSWSSYRAVRKAERSKAREIRTPQQIEGTVLSVARRSRRILGARLVVVRVASEIWQPVVRRLAADSSAIVVDVSEPTENLLWELDALEAQFRSRRILVGDRARLEYLASPGKAATRGQLFERLATYLDGEEILAYEGESRRDMKRFAVGLRARLERAG
jgi:membrane protein implicated in regulation of membrane protease activity